MEKGNKTVKRLSGIWIRVAQAAIVAILLLGAEFAVDGKYVNKIFLASPSQIVNELGYMIQHHTLVPHLVITLQEALVGYGLSAVTGIVIGVLFVSFPQVEELFSPFFAAVMAVPKTAVMPLLVVWFGIGFQSKVLLVFLFCMFTVLFNTVSGAKQTKEEHLKVARVFKATRAQIVFKILIPSALPSIFTGLRVTAATAITGVIFSEMTAAKKGAGYLLNEAQAVLNTPELYLIVIIVTLISVLFVSLVNLTEQVICRDWRKV